MRVQHTHTRTHTHTFIHILELIYINTYVIIWFSHKLRRPNWRGVNWKKERVKKRKTSIRKENLGFPSGIERWEEYKFCLGELWPFNAFLMLKKTFSKHWLIKIRMSFVYIKPKVKSDGTEAMSSTLNAAFIEWLDENWSLTRDEWQRKM